MNKKKIKTSKKKLIRNNNNRIESKNTCFLCLFDGENKILLNHINERRRIDLWSNP